MVCIVSVSQLLVIGESEASVVGIWDFGGGGEGWGQGGGGRGE